MTVSCKYLLYYLAMGKQPLAHASQTERRMAICISDKHSLRIAI